MTGSFRLLRCFRHGPLVVLVDVASEVTPHQTLALTDVGQAQLKLRSGRNAPIGRNTNHH